jgi:hypothetical protein
MKTFKLATSIQTTNFLNRKSLFLMALAAWLFTGCQKDFVTNSLESDAAQEVKMAASKQKLNDLIKENKLVPNYKFFSSSNANVDDRTTVESRSSVDRNSMLPDNADYNFYKDIIRRAINPNDYECGPTILDAYIPPLIADWNNMDFFYYNLFGDLPLYEGFILDNTEGGDFFGQDGEYTNVTNRVFRDLKRFWNIPTDIQIADAHGTAFKDVSAIATLIKLLYTYNGGPVPDAIALSTAEELKIIFGGPKFYYYNHPLFTFNAFATSGFAPLGIPKKIVMGDGIQKAYEDLGYGDVAPQAIIAHEYGHHVQFALNVVFVNSPEGTRRTELMADALSAYYLTHKRGATMNWHRVQQFLQVFYSIGDCGFNSNGHHGTPNQRMKAAEFGYQIANQAQKQGKILTSQAFIALFEAALPSLVAPDAN